MLVAIVSIGAGASSTAQAGHGHKPPRGKLGITTNVADGSQLSGSVNWNASVSGGGVKKVDFLIDGTSRWTQTAAPYQYGGDSGALNTTALTDGAHTLAVKAYGPNGLTATTKVSVSVANGSKPSPPPATLSVTSNIGSGATLTGSVLWTATPSAAVTKIEFKLDGALKWTESLSPYQYAGDPNGRLDTTTLADGSHTLGLTAYASDGQTANRSISITVSNAATAPPPPPPPPTAPLSVTSNIASGATLTGSLLWTATPSAAVTKIEFKLDGALKWTESISPYQYAGDPNGRLDTTTLANGPHTLGLTAYASDGRTANLSIPTTVSNTVATTPPPPPPPPPPSPSYGSIPRFGVATGYKILTRSAADQAFELDQIKAVGGKIVRFDSTTGNQSQVDAVVPAVLARGMEPLLVLGGTRGLIDPAAAAAFAGSQAAKWRGRVRLYEFLNEPDLHGWTGTTYAQALIPVYDAIKAADPNAIVLAGALWKGAGGPVQFVTDMYNAGAKGHFDMISLHLYDDPLAVGSWNIWNMAFHFSPSVRSVMDAHGDADIPIASTETGGPVTTYGEAGQASIVGHDFDALSDPRLAFILVYSMLDDDVPGFGLLRPDRTQRPAWAVYKNRAG